MTGFNGSTKPRVQKQRSKPGSATRVQHSSILSSPPPLTPVCRTSLGRALERRRISAPRVPPRAVSFSSNHIRLFRSLSSPPPITFVYSALIPLDVKGFTGDRMVCERGLTWFNVGSYAIRQWWRERSFEKTQRTEELTRFEIMWCTRCGSARGTTLPALRFDTIARHWRHLDVRAHSHCSRRCLGRSRRCNTIGQRCGCGSSGFSSASGASHVTSPMGHWSRCCIIIGPTLTWAPHPLGHRRGCLRRAVGRERGEFKKMRKTPFVPARVFDPFRSV